MFKDVIKIWLLALIVIAGALSLHKQTEVIKPNPIIAAASAKPQPASQTAQSASQTDGCPFSSWQETCSKLQLQIDAIRPCTAMRNIGAHKEAKDCFRDAIVK